MTAFNLIPLLPELFIIITAMGFLIVGLNIAKEGRDGEATEIVSWASCVSYAIAALILVVIGWKSQIILNGMFKLDSFAGLMKLLVLAGVGASLALSVKYLKDETIARFEYPVLVSLAGVGMMMMVSSNSLLSLYMGLELQSLSLYVLAAFNRNSVKSSEAGLKYFILGALSSGMLLFGISLIYGFTGSVDYGVIQAALLVVEQVPFGITFGLVFILAGLAFKISAVPFHMWTPDVYQGAPSSVTAFFAIAPKIAAMALLVRLLLEPFGSVADQWGQIIYFVSVGSMVLGAFAAISQENIKRLMAYSSIGNMGYALIGLCVGTAAGVSGLILYLLIYMIMTIGTFSIILSMQRDGKSYEKISDLSGLSKTNPVLAYSMAILMFSMSGIPPMAGFFGKLFIFEAAVAAEYYVLATLGVLTSVVAAYYYLRIIKVMFFDEAADPFDANLPFARRALLFISLFFVLGFILKPSVLLLTVEGAAAVFFPG